MVKCPNGGFLYCCETEMPKCPRCGCNLSFLYEKEKPMGNKKNTPTTVRIQSAKDSYYEFDPSAPPLWEDAWGKYYIGNCYSKRDSCFIKRVTICMTTEPYYVYSMWKHIVEKHLDFTNTAFIPIIDYISCGYGQEYLIEDYYDGVSLYDLMHGQICGAEGNRIEFAVKMLEMYQSRKIDFATLTVKDILFLIDSIHVKGLDVRFLEIPENIIFTARDGIKIRVRGSLLSVCNLQFTIIPDVYVCLFPGEFVSPEWYKSDRRVDGKGLDEKSEVYTAGLFLYCILTGHFPDREYSTLEDCHKAHGRYIDHRDDNYEDRPIIRMPLQSYEKFPLDDIQDECLKRIIEKATRESPSERFMSANEFIEALDDDNFIFLEDDREKHTPWLQRMCRTFLSNYHLDKLFPANFLFIFYLTFFSLKSAAQNTMRISYTDGNTLEIPIGQIDSIFFIEKTADSFEASITGEWFWGGQEQRYYEVLTFNEDHTYTGYDNYFSYGFDTMTYGYWGQIGAMLTLQSNGFGYQRRYNWYITDMTENALAVMTKMGPFTYYRLHPDTIHLKVGESMPCINGDSFIFADGVTVRIADDGALEGVLPGTTYVEKLIAETNSIFAYKVIVE